MPDHLKRCFVSTIFVALCFHFASTSGVTKKHEGKPSAHEGKTQKTHHERERKSGPAGHITGTRGGHHTHPEGTHTTTNYIQYKIRNRWRKANMTTKDYWFSNESISLGSYSFEPLEWSDDRLPQTLRPLEEHVERWKGLMKEVTYQDTSDPEITVDPNLSTQRYYQCIYCFKKYDTDVKLDHHYHKHHADLWQTPSTPEPLHRCVYCMGHFKQSQFRAHQQAAHNLTVEKYPFEEAKEMTYDSFNTDEARRKFDERFGGSDEYKYQTYPKNNTFFMTIYDIDSNASGPITYHYVDPWPNDANDY